MASSHILYFVANDTLPELTGVIKDDDGDVIDITGYGVKLNIGYATAKEKTASLTDPTKGVFKVTWVDGDLVAGTWGVEIEVTDADSKILTAQKTNRGRRFTFVISEEEA